MFEDVYKILLNVTEVYFLPSNKASNIITLKAKALSPDSLYKYVAHVLEKFSQIRSKLYVLLSEKKLY